MRRRFKSGFTLTELMIVTGLSTTILTGLIAVFIGSSRHVRGILLEADMAMRARDLRERLLFQVAPPTKTTRYGGLLSSRPNGSNGAKLMQSGSTWIVNVPKMTSSSTSATPSFGTENLTLALDDTGLYETSHKNSNWLKPANFPLDWTADEFTDTKHKGTGFLDALQFDYSKDTDGNKGANYRVTLRYSLQGMTRVERIHIPVAGVQQRSFAEETFHDYSNK